MFLNAALMHWAFKISANPSSPIDSLAFTESANTHPLPFKVAFEPRTMDLVTLRSMFEMYGQ